MNLTERELKTLFNFNKDTLFFPLVANIKGTFEVDGQTQYSLSESSMLIGLKYSDEKGYYIYAKRISGVQILYTNFLVAVAKYIDILPIKLKFEGFKNKYTFLKRIGNQKYTDVQVYFIEKLFPNEKYTNEKFELNEEEKKYWEDIIGCKCEMILDFTTYNSGMQGVQEIKFDYIAAYLLTLNALKLNEDKTMSYNNTLFNKIMPHERFEIKFSKFNDFTWSNGNEIVKKVNTIGGNTKKKKSTLIYSSVERDENGNKILKQHFKEVS